MSAIRLLALLVLCSCFAFSPAIAGKRVALVIGNSGYQNAPRLSNPMNDAIAVAAMFKAANFDSVESKFDLSATNLRKALREFSDRTRDADVAVVYFGGHGIELAYPTTQGRSCGCPWAQRPTPSGRWTRRAARLRMPTSTRRFGIGRASA